VAPGSKRTRAKHLAECLHRVGKRPTERRPLPVANRPPVVERTVVKLYVLRKVLVFRFAAPHGADSTGHRTAPPSPAPRGGRVSLPIRHIAAAAPRPRERSRSRLRLDHAAS